MTTGHLLPSVPAARPRPTVEAAPRVRLHLLGGFRLECAGTTLDLPLPAQRLLALLAIRHRASRVMLAGTLWPEASEQRAQGSLRTSIWRLHQAEPDLVCLGRRELRLNSQVSVDVHELEEWTAGRHDRAMPPPSVLDDGDLLPDWDDDWVLFDRERSRQLRLHALDDLVRSLADQHRYAEALAVAFDLVRHEPLRESGHRLVICVHLAEGNQSEALRQYDRFRELLSVELGIPPSRALRELIAGVGA